MQKIIPYTILIILTVILTSFITWRIITIGQDTVVLHNTMTVTEIQIANDGLCMYQLSQPSISKNPHRYFDKMKMKTACGVYNVNEQLILIKKSR